MNTPKEDGQELYETVTTAQGVGMPSYPAVKTWERREDKFDWAEAERALKAKWQPKPQPVDGKRLFEAIKYLSCFGATGISIPYAEWNALREAAQMKYNEKMSELAADVLAGQPDSNPWIPCSERMPTKEDADMDGDVEWWTVRDGCSVTASLEYYSAKTSHWRRVIRPSPPEPVANAAFEKLWKESSGETWATDKSAALVFFEAGQKHPQ